MANTYDDGLGYGQLGDPTYFVQRRTWDWQRPLESCVCIEAVGASQIVVPSPLSAQRHDAHQDYTTRKFKASGHGAPEITPAGALLPDLARTSSEILEATKLHDPSTGDLLAFGSVRDSSINKKITVVAFVSDAGKRCLSVITVRSQKQGWANDKHDFIQVPQIAGEHGFWESPSPIQQVTMCKDGTQNRGTAAVRTRQGTYVLRIKIDRQAGQRLFDVQATRIRISVQSFVSSHHGQALQQSDVAINPWMPTHLATTNVAGRWEISEVAKFVDGSNTRMMKQISSGLIDDGEDGSEVDVDETRYDGWSRVIWIYDQYTILACNRTTMTLADISSGSSCIVVVEQTRRQCGIWILDLRVDPSHPARFFLLTPMFIYHVQLDEKVAPDKKRNLAVTSQVLSKVRHFRDPLDPSLRLSLTSHDGGTAAVISSAASPSCSCVFFNNISGSWLVPATVSTLCLVPDSRLEMTDTVASTFIQPVKWSDDLDSGFAEEYRQRGINFWTTICLHRDLSISQQLCAVSPATDLGQDSILPPQWRSRNKHTPKRLAKQSFVVEDEDDDDYDFSNLLPPETTLEVVKRKRPWKRSLNLELVYQTLLDRNANPSDDLTSHLLQYNNSGQQGSSCKLLIDSSSPKLQVSDLQESINAFDELLQHYAPHSMSSGSKQTITPISSAQFLRVALSGPIPHHFALESIYNGIVASWLSPLADVPGRARLAREQLCRRVAAQLCLASYTSKPVVQFEATPLAPDPIQQSFPSQLLSSQLQSSQSQLATPAAPTQTTLSAALSRLSSLTAVTPSTRTPVAFSSTAESILSHWNTASTPQEYSWSSTRALVKAQREHHASMSQLSERDRARRERKAAKLRARREKEEHRARIESSQAEQHPGLRVWGHDSGRTELALRSVPEERHTQSSPPLMSSQQPATMSPAALPRQPFATPQTLPPQGQVPFSAQPIASSQLFTPFTQGMGASQTPIAGLGSQARTPGPARKKVKVRRRTEGF
ncbi:hypothetical protein K461DRAFT_312443 [Myriangium duriaei CBS 260.36]|uniref:RNA polymerase I-specific transcription initiation factor RRN6-like protein n=1 Tax=Myriangium duriaei CBS 260.36 TaxID=1168546 RepID=A0A9P4J3S2_9PEZI|nr:hypothetical protein K461DRAFT_312443 [Myriangium duriaei CBS 260.36]